MEDNFAPPDFVPIPPPFAEDWEAMDTAPKDGRDILVAHVRGRQLIARWHQEREQWVAIGETIVYPTYWKSLPASPEPPELTLLPGDPRLRRAPRLSSLDPSSATLGAPAFTLHVYGRGFGVDAVILWNGAPEPTTRVSDTEVTTVVDMATAEVAIEIPVAVQNGTTGL